MKTFLVSKELQVALLNYLESCAETNKHDPHDEAGHLIEQLDSCKPVGEPIGFYWDNKELPRHPFQGVAMFASLPTKEVITRAATCGSVPVYLYRLPE